MRRLYIGGLSHSVSKKDLKDRFGKFGVVEDVELRTRKDDEGVPYKTFGYVNINISDADLKKCMTVLNKSRWKGGTLQIEPAKESFLHRLAEERQAVEEKQLQQPAAEDKREKLLDSLSKAGVDNFTMKAAVPGTEIPGHKDWVVSKYGRVLPIMQLRCKKGNKARTLKHDPSKYSHNIRRLNLPTTDQSTPVTKLTWHVEGGDDDISKKRRGEFPPYEPPRPKRSRADGLSSHNIMDRTRSAWDVDTKPHLANGFAGPFNSRPAGRRGARLPDSDIDSDEEMHRLVAIEKSFPGGLRQDVQDDDLEVVGLDYLVKSGSSSLHQRGRRGDEEEDDYDSADTDELFLSKKHPLALGKQTQPCAGGPSGSNTEKKKKKKKKTKKKYETAEKEEQKGEEEACDSRKPSSTQLKKNSAEKHGRRSEDQQTKLAVLPVAKPYSSESVSAEENEDQGDEMSDSAESESDYEAMFSNVTRLEISLADLQRVAEEFQQTVESTAPSILSHASNGTAKHIPKKGTTPEEILSSILEEDSSEDEKKKKKRKKTKVRTKFPAFQGTHALDEETGKEVCQRTQKEEEEKGSTCKPQKLTHYAPDVNSLEDERKDRMKPAEERSESREDTEEEEETKEEMVTCTQPPKDLKENLNKPETSSSSSSDEDEEEEEKVMGNQTVDTAKAAAKSTPSSSAVKESESTSSDEEVEWPKQEGIVTASPRVPRGAKEEEELQKRANMRRLAAVQQRQKEAEEHKRLIQGALANLDTSATRTGKHVVFESDDDEDEDRQPVSSQVLDSEKTLAQDSKSEGNTAGSLSVVSENESSREKAQVNPSGPQLFLSSEDEEDGHEEEDGSRFKIRPQFEGQAGQKLMELQSRFGIDERFRMDSRFLEEDDDKEKSEKKTSLTEDNEALEEERKKNLLILQSVLGSSQQTCSSKTTSKAKTFRDVSALHYDPSREEHSAFETKTDDSKKESKSARRKKKEEAQKLPEVSKELYYNVSGDLKAMFGGAKDEKVEEEEKTNWDKEEEEDREEEEEDQQQPPLFFSEPVEDRDELSGFQFSFFGYDVKRGHGDTEDYKVESIQAPKVSWQQDPRLQESSSEEEEQEEDDKKVSSALKTTDEETSSKEELFFFFPDDSRLTEGPRLFCRSSQLEEQRGEWEERRIALRKEFRKKHRDARRKLKPAQRS